MSRSVVQEGALVADIETVSAWDLLTDYQRGHLDKLHDRRKDAFESGETAEDLCALQPATGRIVSIALLNPVMDAGEVIYDGDFQIGQPDENRIAWTTGSEKQMLERFWRIVQGRQFISFNGMSFDAPFLVARSIYCGVKPLQRISPKWPDRSVHLDLRDELSVLGKVKCYNLAFACELFGIKSSKSVMDGSQVGQAYRDGRVREIAEYNLLDVRATAELLRRVAPFLPEWTK